MADVTMRLRCVHAGEGGTYGIRTPLEIRSFLSSRERAGERSLGVSGECYPERQMFRAVYRQIARFLDWVNGTGSSASRATREAAEHRRDVESRNAGSFWDSGGGGGI
jgi:hypothetical protein